MICPSCGLQNDIAARFCEKYGLNLKYAEFLEYGGLMRRYFASLIDDLVFTPLIFVFLVSDLSLLTALIILLFASWIYCAGMESSAKQATLGKMAIGLVVVDMEGDRISFRKATVRHFSKILSGLFLAIGYWMIAFDEKKQGLHDMIADCLIVVRNHDLRLREGPDYGRLSWRFGAEGFH